MMLGKPSRSRTLHEYQRGIKEDTRAAGMEGANPMRAEDKPVAQPEAQGTPGKENPESADEVYIPDYVMLDFGTLRNN